MRYDYSHWLIHFVRDRLPEQDFPGENEEDADYYAGGELDVDAPAIQVLRTIVRLGGLLPGYSFRRGRTTIYGGKPAVCATEMPLYSLAVYARSRANAGKVSVYGIRFLKAEFYAAGGRPVIYGLATKNVSMKTNGDCVRILDESLLPLHEQFRYVAYNPTADNWVDWSHEREWRWVCKDPEREYVWCRNGSGIYGPTPGLCLVRPKNDGGHFSRLAVIVWNQAEAKIIQEDLTGFYLAGGNNYDTTFDQQLIERSFIIALEDVVHAVEQGKNLDAQTIEGLEEASLIRPILLSNAPPNADQMIKMAFEEAAKAGETAAEAASDLRDSGACGFAHAVTSDVTNPLVQKMIADGLASGPFDGDVYIKVHAPSSQSIEFNERVQEAIAKTLTKQLGIRVFMTSRLD